MHKAFLQLTGTDGESLLLDLSAVLVVEPVTYRRDDGQMSTGTQFTYHSGLERTVKESFGTVLAKIMGALETVRALESPE